MTLLLTGCSLFKNNNETPKEMLAPVSPRWFSVSPKHALVDKEGKALSHLFFDPPLDINRGERVVNAIIATPKFSKHAYALDVNSGQRYFTHTYCSQKDIWNLQNGTFKSPPFSVGYIPRALDQLGEAQKVIIFSDAVPTRDSYDNYTHRVKLIGAYIESHCLDGNCLGKDNWLSKLVFIGVDGESAELSNINSLNGLQKSFDWEEAKAHLENMDGRNFSGDKTYPALRVGQLIEFDEAHGYFKKRSVMFSENESKKVQSSCHALYDQLWKGVGFERPEDRRSTTVDELNAKLKIREELKAKAMPAGFAARLRAFTKKYHKEFITCEKFIYHGNINEDPEAFWFLSYMAIFYRLNNDGYYFNCNLKSWQKNAMDEKGNSIFNLSEGIENCNDRDIDLAMNYLPNFLAGLKASSNAYYRFVDYDTHTFGSHRKIYSWVKMNPKKFECSNDINEDIKKKMSPFPEDVKWKERDVTDIEKDLKLIY